jgi:hypothetical protein
MGRGQRGVQRVSLAVVVGGVAAGAASCAVGIR